MTPVRSDVHGCWVIDLRPHHMKVVWAQVIVWCLDNFGSQKRDDVWLWHYQNGTIFLYREDYVTAFMLRWS